MTTIAVAEVLRERGQTLQHRLPPVVVSGLLVILGVALGIATTSISLVQAALAVAAGLLLVIGCVLAPRQAVVGLVAWLTLLAMFRRMLLQFGLAGKQDALLLVAPVAISMLVLVAARRGALQRRSSLTNAVLILTGLVLLSALNPLQGGLTVGLGGLLFVLVPLLWFWVGRALVDEQLLHRVLSVVSFLAIGAAVYGLAQVYRGFPPWDEAWIAAKGYGALQVGDALRQFASFASAGEYVTFLAIGAVVWFLRAKTSRWIVPALSVLVLLGWALAVASVRNTVIFLLVALVVVFAAGHGFGLGKTALVAFASLMVAVTAVSFINPEKLGGDRTGQLLTRQVEGLSSPFDQEVSTLPIHIGLIVEGLGQALRNPVGQGLGVITLAGSQFGGQTTSTEADPSNMAVALGLPGLLCYSYIVAVALPLAFRTARSRRDLLSLSALGILLVTSLQWLNGGAYAIAPLPWLVLGWLDSNRVQTVENGPSLH